jgi:5-formyltetrahydrofolate cyclo-ligase
MTDKAQLRAQLRAARAKIRPEAAAAAAQGVAGRTLVFLLETLSALDPACTPVALYASLPGELDSFLLLQALAAKDFPTLLPVAGAKATPLAFHLWRPGEKLVSGRFGLREPQPSAPEMSPKIIFAPLLGFDAEGGRLGFGGGYYDATLAHLRRAGQVLAGGLAFASQQVERIPREKHDERLDFVITEERIFRFPALSASLDP